MKSLANSGNPQKLQTPLKTLIAACFNSSNTKCTLNYHPNENN